MPLSSSSSSSSGSGLTPPPVPCCKPCHQCPPDTVSHGTVRYGNGATNHSSNDLQSPGGGNFGVTRLFSNVKGVVGQGIGGSSRWVYSHVPTASAPSDSIVQIMLDPDRRYWFFKSGTSYVPYYSFLNVALVENTTDQTLTFTDNSYGKTEITVFNSLLATVNPGQFLSHTDGNGAQTTIYSQSGGQVTELRRSFADVGGTSTESLVFQYFGSGTAAGNLESVLYQVNRASGGGWQPVKQVLYAYYPPSDPNQNGSYDLQSVSQQLPNGTGWNTVAVDYYRYWLGGSSMGFAHALKLHLGPEAYRLVLNANIDPTSAPDSVLQAYADHYFEYDPITWQITKETSAVCESCPGGGVTADQFEYIPNGSYPANGFNTWAMKTIQTLPDSSQIVVYTNFAGQPMLKVNIDTSTPQNMWGTFYLYGSDGQLIWEALPSAVTLPTSLSTMEDFDDLMNVSSGSYAFLNASAGLINVTSYDASGNLLTQGVQQGSTGSIVGITSYGYVSNTDSNGNTVYRVSNVSSNNGTGTVTTSYGYNWSSGTNVMTLKQTVLPIISTTQNGPGGSTHYTVTEQYDAYGNLIQKTDAYGMVSSIVSTYTNDVVLSRVTQQIQNFQSGGGTAVGVNVTTNSTYDNLGRLTLTLGPSHNVILGAGNGSSGTSTTVRSVTSIAYNSSAQPAPGTAWPVDQTYTGNGYATGTTGSYTYTLLNPISISNTDKDGRSTDQITSVRSSGATGLLSPTETSNQADWQSWSSMQYDSQHRTLSSRAYFLIPSPSLGTGTVGTHFGQTDYRYDALERRNGVVAPGGTITRTVWTSPQRVASIWVGTNDTGATDADPTGGHSNASNNMVVVTANIYDNGTIANPGGSGGDGNLVQQIQYVSATASDTRVTNYNYDFRDRRIGMTDAIGRYTAYTLDNLDRQTGVDSYNVSVGTRIASSTTSYDDLNRTYQTSSYAVNSDGSTGNYLLGQNWYDPSGNLLQKVDPNDHTAFTKYSYNGVGWVTATYRGYNTTGNSYNQASGVTTGDMIMSQAIPTYDGAGNVTSQAFYARLTNETTTGLALSGTSSPLARVSYAASWYDGIDRSFANGNYGASSTAPSMSTLPTSSSNGSTPVLLTQTVYNASSGRADQTIDANGIITAMSYDAAGRTTQAVEDAASGGLQRTTSWTYNVDNLVTQLQAVNATTGNQNTNYSYGSTTAVYRKDLLASVTYPDSGVVTYTYNQLGQVRTIQDQRGVVRTIYYDKLGRQTNDCVTTTVTGVDASILQIATSYEIRGMPQAITSYNSMTPNSGTVENQVQLVYNTFGQLTQEYQEHNGAANTSSSASVQYGYLPSSASSNQIWPSTLVYPNGRTISYSRSASGANLSRIDSISDTSATLASYKYLGDNRVTRITYPQPSVWLDLWGGGSTAAMNGLDQYGRVTDQRWQNNIGGGISTAADIDRYQYVYDFNSNRLSKGNAVSHAAGVYLDEVYAYDHLNRLTDMQRGNLVGGVISGTPSTESNYTLDPTGNWSNYQTSGGGTVTLNQGRASNTVNEITGINASTGSTWVTPLYDPAGNMTTMPQPASPTSGFAATYDAWNRMTSISNSSGGATVATYQYDGRGRRIAKITTGTGGQTHHFYYTNTWQNIEERVGTSASMDTQYVWGLRYIDELICRDDSTASPARRLYATQDANFNLTSITNNSGNEQERYLFDPYGSRTIMNATWGVLTTSTYSWIIGHQGLTVDQESWLVYNRDRSRSIATGSFIQRDPLLYIDSSNLYEVAKGSPIRFMDPFGDATIRVWEPRGDAYGHVSLELCDKTYVSWWPTNTQPKSDYKIGGVSADNPKNVDADVVGEGHQPDKVVDIDCSCFDEAAMKKWWEDNYVNNKSATWSALNDSCAGVVKAVLNKGVSGFNPEYANLDNTHAAWTPKDAGDYAEDLKRWCDEKKKGVCHAVGGYVYEAGRGLAVLPYRKASTLWSKAKILYKFL